MILSHVSFHIFLVLTLRECFLKLHKSAALEYWGLCLLQVRSLTDKVDTCCFESFILVDITYRFIIKCTYY